MILSHSRRMKKSLASLLALFLLIPKTSAESLYTDGYFSEAIYWTHEWGIFSGYPDGSFGGEDEMNRAELSKVLVLGSGIAEEDVGGCAAEKTQIFTDVSEGMWYTDYIYCAQAQGWVSGDDGLSTFRPGDPILMGEAFKMIVESHYGHPDESYDGSVWYITYINFLTEYKVIVQGDYGYEFTYLGVNDSSPWIGFNPGQVSSKVKRSEIAELIYRLRVIFTEGDGEPYNLFLSLEEMNETYGMEYTVSDDTLSIADEYFGFRFDDLPLDKIGSAEDLRVYIQDPSGFTHEDSSEWVLAYPSDEWVDGYSSMGYQRLFRIYISHPDGYYFDCTVYQSNSISDLLEQACVVDEENNITADYLNFRPY